MKYRPWLKSSHYTPVKTISILVVIVSMVGLFSSGFRNKAKAIIVEPAGKKTDSVASVRAFLKVYKVLMSPRCMNCHPSGDIPLQGDDSHLHTMLPRRGKEGKGVYAMKCANCHQPTHTAGLHTPPGSPNWHLPPAHMKMVFQGRTPHQLARQIIDPKQNGGKNRKQLLEHAQDELVQVAWKPGEGRTLPPMSHEEFVKEWTTWIEKGAFAPNAKIKAEKK